MLDTLKTLVGDKYVLSGADMDRWSSDVTGAYVSTPLAVVRPANTAEVSRVMTWANTTGTAVVPVSGNTGLAGATSANGAVLMSLDRLNQIVEIRSDARHATVQSGVILSTLHDAVGAHDLVFPLTFGARGSAMIGGCLATNAGGINVLRYGNTRDLVLGIEAVMPNGEIMNLMTGLHKNNSGYDLRHLLIGSEGTLGIITGAIVKLFPKPRAYATAMIAMRSLPDALGVLHRLQEVTGNAVEAFEYMPRLHIETFEALNPEARPPFDAPHDINIMVEIGAMSEQDARPDASGALPVETLLEEELAALFESGAVLDAVVARSETQRQEMWARREASAEVAMSRKPVILCDVAVPLDQVAPYLTQMEGKLAEVDPGAVPTIVAHLGDGNIHYSVWPSRNDPALSDAIMAAVEQQALDLGGSFSAEHGIGLSKKPAMVRHKDPVALAAMRAIKDALDPNNILNPGKVLP